MSALVWVALGAATWGTVSAILAPWVGAAIAGRQMTHSERENFGWGVLGLTLGLFVIASVLIGGR